MPTKVDTHPTFRKGIRRIRRRFPSIHHDLRPLFERLRNDERPGQREPGVGYYARLSARVILLTIYSKTDEVDISADEVRQLVLEAEV